MSADNSKMHETALPVFRFDAHDVRVYLINDELIWVLADVCACLGISNAGDVVKRLESSEYINIDKSYVYNQGRDMLGITEAGLYNVIFCKTPLSEVLMVV